MLIDASLVGGGLLGPLAGQADPGADPPIPTPAATVFALQAVPSRSSWLSVAAAIAGLMVVPAVAMPGMGPTYDDATAINYAISQAGPGGWVGLIPGATYTINTPILMQQGVTLASLAAVAAAASGATTQLGATLKIGSGFSSAGQPYPAAVLFTGNSASGLPNTNQGGLIGVWADGSASPPGIDGIAGYGNYAGVLIDKCLINQPTGNGISLNNDASTHFPDGWHLSQTMVNKAGADGITGRTSDMVATDTHVQGCTGRGWYLNGSNTRLTGCRADSNAHGFVTDVFYSDGGGFVLEGCGTQSNIGHGIWAYNSSTNGNSPRQPLTVNGGTFYGDGSDLASAAIMASGVVTLIANNCQVLCDTNGSSITSPVYGVGTEKLGGNGPVLVQVWGGFINAVTACVHDAAPAQLMSYKFHGVQGGSWNGNATPASPTLFTLNS